ncbi:hypothetical protein GCM10023196_049280 [Actinoallomurus vinaceus]|uniref:Uncharacterized protein n=1 Tax=Actinoallomurus vinaceus TaxID=1080074 RepID=A0ABP8UCY1_9ACTN
MSSGNTARKLVLRGFIAAGSAAMAVTAMSGPAHATSWQKVNNGQLVYLKDGKCKTAGMIHNIYPTAATAYSQLQKGKCWHWVKLWVVQPKTGTWKELFWQGSGRTNFVSKPPAYGPIRNNKGWYGYRAELGLCGSKGHCVTKHIQVPHWGK